MVKYCSIPVLSLECTNLNVLITLLVGHYYRIFRFVNILQCVALDNLKHLLKHIETTRAFKNIYLLLWPILFWIDICLRKFVNKIITKPYIWIFIMINAVSFLSKSFIHDTLRSCAWIGLTLSFGHSLHLNK